MKVNIPSILSNHIAVALLLLSTVLITGCSSTNKPKIQQFFRTNIHDDNSKFFTFSLIVIPSQPMGDEDMLAQKAKAKQAKRGSKNGKRNKQNRNPDSAQSMASSHKTSKNSKMTLMLLDRLNEKLVKNQYCRQGFIELDRDISRTVMVIKGECHDSASKEDRRQFPDTVY